MIQLPPLLTLNDCGGVWDDYLEAVHSVYLREIVQGGLMFRGWRVSVRRTPETRGKAFGFWHMVQEGAVEEDRTPDFRRLERLCWVAHVIRAADQGSPEVSVWENKRGSEIHVPLWVETMDYLVILAKRPDYWLLKTQYPVNSRKAYSLRRERDAFNGA